VNIVNLATIQPPSQKQEITQKDPLLKTVSEESKTIENKSSDDLGGISNQ
jgi:hypothetical protein